MTNGLHTTRHRTVHFAGNHAAFTGIERIHPANFGFAGRRPQLAGQLEILGFCLSTVLSNETPHVAAEERGETIMFNLTQVSRTTQQYVCMALAAFIVTASLSLGAYAADAATNVGYSVTITQIA
jgi:hypothetical protein